MLEVECPAVTPEAVLKASGHVDRFTDFMVSDAHTGDCHRADHLLEEALQNFAADKPRALKMAVDPIGPLPPGTDPVELASWTAFSNVLLNLDESLMRR